MEGSLYASKRIQRWRGKGGLAHWKTEPVMGIRPSWHRGQRWTRGEVNPVAYRDLPIEPRVMAAGASTEPGGRLGTQCRIKFLSGPMQIGATNLPNRGGRSLPLSVVAPIRGLGAEYTPSTDPRLTLVAWS